MWFCYSSCMLCDWCKHGHCVGCAWGDRRDLPERGLTNVNTLPLLSFHRKQRGRRRRLVVCDCDEKLPGGCPGLSVPRDWATEGECTERTRHGAALCVVLYVWVTHRRQLCVLPPCRGVRLLALAHAKVSELMSGLVCAGRWLSRHLTDVTFMLPVRFIYVFNCFQSGQLPPKYQTTQKASAKVELYRHPSTLELQREVLRE